MLFPCSWLEMQNLLTIIKKEVLKIMFSFCCKYKLLKIISCWTVLNFAVLLKMWSVKQCLIHHLFPLMVSWGCSIANNQNVDYVLSYVPTNLVSSGDFRGQINNLWIASQNQKVNNWKLTRKKGKLMTFHLAILGAL